MLQKLKWAGIVLGLAFLALLWSVRPGTLTVHVRDPWKSVNVVDFNKSHPAPYSPPGDVLVWPLSYGVYGVFVTFADGQTAYLEYFHYDAGVRKRVKMTVERQGDDVRVVQTYNGGETVQGTIAIGRTSAEKPFKIDDPAGGPSGQ